MTRGASKPALESAAPPTETNGGDTPTGGRLHDRGAPCWTGSLFGLTVEADFPVLGLSVGSTVEAKPAIRLCTATPEELHADWPQEDVARLIERREHDGSLIMSVQEHKALGYLVDAPGHGRFRVSTDGATASCALEEGPWQGYRALFAQALPLAATLRGVELLHASAVALDGRAYAFVGHSGAGKTSLALHLVDQGASLLTDDVLAVTVAGESVSAHPGAPFANIAPEQLEALSPDGRARFGRLLGRSDKIHLAVNAFASEPLPLAALYQVRRRRGAQRISFGRSWPPNPQALLGATFMPHVITSSRLRVQLETCARIASGVHIYTMLVPFSMTAAKVAVAVGQHAAALP